ncbi:MAG: hypothetical protein HDT43_07615 [Ruminococcaceae bacterium]|nr:hypothetical protein [Oscillospiraceae bacterium]
MDKFKNSKAFEKIIKDFRKTFRRITICDCICAVLETVAFLLCGVFTKMPLAVIAVICTAFFWGVAAWSLNMFLLSGKRFAKKLEDMPGDKGTELLSQYENAHSLGNRWFLGEYLLFYRNRRIELLRYDTIRSAEPKGFKMVLELLDGKIERLPLGPNENPAFIVAALRSKNPQISVKLNGKIIEKMENRKDSVE